MALIEKKEEIKKEKPQSMKLNKRKLIQYISDKTYSDEKELAYFFDSIFYGIASALQEGYEVPIADFGKFSTKERYINNPSIGFVGKVKRIIFKPTKKLKKIINSNEE